MHMMLIAGDKRPAALTLLPVLRVTTRIHCRGEGGVCDNITHNTIPNDRGPCQGDVSNTKSRLGAKQKSVLKRSQK